MSAHAAAIEAGWRKRETPLETVLRLLPKLSQEDLANAHAAINKLLNERGADR